MIKKVIVAIGFVVILGIAFTGYEFTHGDGDQGHDHAGHPATAATSPPPDSLAAEIAAHNAKMDDEATNNPPPADSVPPPPADPPVSDVAPIYFDGIYHYVTDTENNYIYRVEIPGTTGAPNHSPTVCYVTENKNSTMASAGIYCIPAN